MALQIAQGDVAVVGLRDGLFPNALAAKTAVKHVTVYERSMIRRFDFLHSPYNFDDDKIHVVNGDARDTLRDKVHDFLYVDTYGKLFTDDVVYDIALYGDNNQIGEYWFRGFELVLLSAVANGQISRYDLPSELGEFLTQLQGTEEARNALVDSDTEYNAEVLNALSQSCASSLDTVVSP